MNGSWHGVFGTLPLSLGLQLVAGGSLYQGLAIFFTVEMLWKVYGWSAQLHLFANTVLGSIQGDRGPEFTLEANSFLPGVTLAAWRGGSGGL